MNVFAPAKELAENTAKEDAKPTVPNAEEEFNWSVQLKESLSIILVI